MPIFVSIDRLRINGIDLVVVTQQVIDQQTTGGFQRHQHSSGVCLMLGNLRVEGREALCIMGDLKLGKCGGRVIGAIMWNSPSLQVREIVADDVDPHSDRSKST